MPKFKFTFSVNVDVKVISPDGEAEEGGGGGEGEGGTNIAFNVPSSSGRKRSRDEITPPETNTKDPEEDPAQTPHTPPVRDSLSILAFISLFPSIASAERDGAGR
jgi:hypothetical protein